MINDPAQEQSVQPAFNMGRLSQWPQLLLLTFIHFSIDSYMGMIPALMPGIIAHFGITVIQSVSLIIIPSLLVNIVQLAVGHTRAGKNFPLFIYIGGVLTICGGAINFAPVGDAAFFWLMLLFCLSAVGVGLTHPECFRAVHGLDRIIPEASTATFMIGGQFGYGLGAWLTAYLVVKMGFAGLWLMSLAVVIMLILTVLLRIQLPVESQVKVKTDSSGHTGQTLSFWPIWLMVLPAAVTCSVFLSLLPQRLSEMGFPLDFGGYCHWMFMGGSVAGLIFWSALTRKVNTVLCMTLAFGIGTPVLFAYMFFMQYELSAWLLVVSGGCLMAPFTLLVKEARFAQGFNLGGRMALAAGGTWLVSNLAFFGISYAFKQFSTEAMLIKYGIDYSWTASLLSALIGLWIWKKHCNLAFWRI